MPTMFGRLVLYLMLTCGFLAAAVGGAGAETVLRRGNGGEPTRLDPHLTDGRVESNILRDLFEGLVVFGPDGRVVPGVAEAWEISEDGRIYTFRLRNNAKWSNGDPVTADDFVYSLRRAVMPKPGVEPAMAMMIVANAEQISAGKTPVDQLGIEAADRLTVRITLRNPAPYFLALLSSDNNALPVHRATVEAKGDKWWTDSATLVGNGAYKLAEWLPKQRLSVVRNPHYHGSKAVAIDKVVFLPIADSREELRLFKAGELEVTNEVPQDQVKWISLTHPKEFWNRPLIATYYYALNLTAEPFKANVKLRRALSMVIDREGLVSKITRAGEMPAYGFVPPLIPGYRYQPVSFTDLPLNKRVEQARRLFTEAGYGPNQPLTLDVLFNTSENNQKIAAAVVAMWVDAFGKSVTVNLINTDRADYLLRRTRHAFQVVRAAWFGDYGDPTVFLNLFVSAAAPPRNDPGYHNPKYDELLSTAATTLDPGERMVILQKAEAMLLEDSPVIPLYHYATKSLVSQKIKGWLFNIRDVHTSRFLSLAEGGTPAPAPVK
ncbi:oligopeptide transport system substrate-binding protein [uncultured Gammaproteobacteria bacterium]